MPGTAELTSFLVVVLGFAVTPGPNMIYLISRAIGQGAAAGLISLGGMVLGFVVYLLCAALGITALLTTVPFAHVTLRLVGAVYLMVLAWQALKPGGRSPFEIRSVRRSSGGRLFGMGLVTTLLNPKAALLYLALLPQFIVPGHGSVFVQTLVLGLLHIGVNLVVSVGIALTAGALAGVLARRPAWLRAQRWMMGGLLAAFSVKLAAEG
ncbi:LysE family translocator [Methylobacterium sp. J-068]|uniref:LysE family translocator n=1 Tax=Methylobacterium sp. J-068 TaxID=2836649 RepID=UPI001FBBE901|nr:LysE family translocator [Methylobacterium sp. J-068]MCJ2033391.1 LysE family translocator [Methylobacterium sp. J-068]